MDHTLPFEIAQLIINEIGPDVRALKTCSLVCHAWRELSQCVIFSSLRLTSAKVVSKAEKAMHDHPHLIPYIRTLIITDALEDDQSDRVFDPQCLERSKLIKVIQLIAPNLKSFQMAPGMFTSWEDLLPALKQTIFDLVAHSPLLDFQLDSLHDVPTTLIGAVRALGSMKLTGITLNTPFSDEGVASRHPRQSTPPNTDIRELDIELDTANTFILANVVRNHHFSIQSLSVSGTPRTTSLFCEKIVYSLRNLKRLQIRILDTMGRIRMHELNLAPYPDLTELCMVATRCERRGNPFPVTWVLDALRTKRQRDLAFRLEIYTRPNPFDSHYQSGSWDDLDELLVHIRAEGIKPITVCFVHFSDTTNRVCDATRHITDNHEELGVIGTRLLPRAEGLGVTITSVWVHPLR